MLDHLPAGSGTVLDVGCGNGKYLTRIRSERPGLTATALDISAGILADVDPPVAIADAAQIPARDDSATTILAMHMLYHVENPDAALGEAARVLAPDGVFMASTNALDDKAELDGLWVAATGDILGVERGPRRISLSSRFALDDAPHALGEHFVNVTVIELPGVITVTDPEPVISHFASYRSWPTRWASRSTTP